MTPSTPKIPASSPASPDKGFCPSIHQMLHRYFTGWYPCPLGETQDTPIGWRKFSHRGIQWLNLEKIRIGSKQKRYVFSPKFQIRYNTAFKEVLAGCADITRDGHTWITPSLIDLFCTLRTLGFAHSFECWQDGQLVGGAFGIQIGGMMTIESMFHRVDHASKAAYVQTLLRLVERGFKLLDVNVAVGHFTRFGAETVPQWQFEEYLRDVRNLSPSLADEFPAPVLPLSVKLHIPFSRVVGAVTKRLRLGSKR